MFVFIEVHIPSVDRARIESVCQDASPAVEWATVIVVAADEPYLDVRCRTFEYFAKVQGRDVTPTLKGFLDSVSDFRHFQIWTKILVSAED